MAKNLDVLGLRYKENKEFIKNVIAMIKKVLTPAENIVKTAPYQELRKEYLEFFNKFPWFEDLKDYITEFFEV